MSRLIETLCGAVILLFSFVVSAAPVSYDKATQERAVEKALVVMEQQFLYWNETKRDVCKRELLDILSLKLRNESGSQGAAERHESAAQEEQCLDRYSDIMTPREADGMRTRLAGGIVGIGVTLSADGSRATVMSVKEGSPAERAGMKSGDVILKARNEGEESYSDITDVDTAVGKIRGAKGSVVHLVIERSGAVLELPPITRKKIEIPTVSFRIVQGVGYISVSLWSDGTADELEGALARVKERGIDRVIIDVRDNPGGSLDGPMEALYYFSSNPNDVLFAVRYRDTEDVRRIWAPLGADCPSGKVCLPFDPETLQPKTPGRFEDMKALVLVNRHSASASEIFAGTMRDWGESRKNIAVLGELSFGKGVGQSVTMLPEGFATRVTSFEYLVGNSRTSVNGIGVFPNYLVDDTRREENLQEDTATRRDAQFMLGVSVLKSMR